MVGVPLCLQLASGTASRLSLEVLGFVDTNQSDKLTRYQQRHQIEASEARQKLVSRVKVAKDPEYFAKQEVWFKQLACSDILVLAHCPGVAMKLTS